MRFKVRERSVERKSESKKLRRDGWIPAVLYGGELAQAKAIAIEKAAFSTVLRTLVKGRLATKKFLLEFDDGSAQEVIIKEIQYHPTSYDPLHIDFLLLDPKKKITVNIPIECEGKVDCIGVKQGGSIRQVKRFLRAVCLPQDLPELFTIDISGLEMRQSKRLRDISIPEGVKPQGDMNEVAVAIVKR